MNLRYTSVALLLINLRFLSILTDDAQNKPAGGDTAATGGVLTYQLVYSDDKPTLLIGTDKGEYAVANQYCYLKKFSDASPPVLGEVDNCKLGAAAINAQCVFKCAEKTVSFEISNLGDYPRYFKISTDASSDTVKTKTTGLNVLGLPHDVIRVYKMTVAAQYQNIVVSTTVPTGVTCKASYGGVQLAAGSAATAANSLSAVNVVFGRFIPYNEILCPGAPSLLYYMKNPYTDTFEENKLQYFVKGSSDATSKMVYLKFMNRHPDEMCLFRIRTAMGDNSKVPWESDCETGAALCYSSCRFVRMKMKSTVPKFVQVSIAKAHNDISNENIAENSDVQVNWVLSGKDLISPVNGTTHVTLNLDLLAPAAITENGKKFSSCAMKMYEANKPKPQNLATPKCSGNTDCASTCTPVTIETLIKNIPYIVEIGDNTFNEIANFKQKFFLKIAASSTSDLEEGAVTVDGSGFKILAKKPAELTVESPTCKVYVSPAGKFLFREANCVKSKPCSGFCQEEMNTINLDPQTQYDIMVVPDKGLGHRTYRALKTGSSKGGKLNLIAIIVPSVIGGLILIGVAVFFVVKSKQ